MYATLLTLHSITRWFIVLALLFSLVRSFRGGYYGLPYRRTDNILRSLTSGLSHLQLLAGIWLYSISPVIRFLFQSPNEATGNIHAVFFGFFHSICMVMAVVFITIGAAKCKRASTDQFKHRFIVRWFGMAALLIFIAIPWSFSPFVARPDWRLP